MSGDVLDIIWLVTEGKVVSTSSQGFLVYCFTFIKFVFVGGKFSQSFVYSLGDVVEYMFWVV